MSRLTSALRRCAAPALTAAVSLWAGYHWGRSNSNTGSTAATAVQAPNPAQQHGASPSAPSPLSPADRATRTKAPRAGTAQAAVEAWRRAVAGADGSSSAGTPPGITLSSRPTPARLTAFSRLLGEITPEAAGPLFDLLAAETTATLTETEWGAFLEKWGRQDGPGAAAHLAGKPSLANHAPGMLYGWAAADPAAATAWLEQQGRGATPQPWESAARRELLLGWLQSDFDGPAHWLDAHRDDAAYSEAAAAFAKEAAAIDPAAALVWAKSIEGPWQSWALQEVGRRWLAREPDAARTALLATGLTEEDLARIAAPAEAGSYDLLEVLGAQQPADRR